VKRLAAVTLFAMLLVSGSGLTAQEVAPLKISGLFYVGYENGKEAGAKYNQYYIGRAYLTAQTGILPRLSARVTIDPSQDREADGRGDFNMRVKYAYAQYNLGQAGTLTGLTLEGGLVHMVWLDFEEHVNPYRMRDPMFMERSGMFNSADVGVTLSGGLGPQMDESYRRDVGSAYANRYGSFAIGLYNGGGYHAVEDNQNKVAEGRFTLRPLPAVLPGLQVSGLAIVGDGNTAANSPNWRNYAVFGSYQHRFGTLTAQYVWGEGNQKGSWVEPGTQDATNVAGVALFGEGRLGGGWRVLAGYDDFERTSGATDLGSTLVHGGVAYDLGKSNILLFDVEQRNWDAEGRPNDWRGALIMQVQF